MEREAVGLLLSVPGCIVQVKLGHVAMLKVLCGALRVSWVLCRRRLGSKEELGMRRETDPSILLGCKPPWVLLRRS